MNGFSIFDFRFTIYVLVVVVLHTAGCRKQGTGVGGQESGVREQLSGTITLSGAWALYPMAVKWAEEFQKIHPKVKIDVAAGGAGKGMADCLSQMADIGMVSREIYPAEIEKGAWWVSVTKDAVVPTVNEKNPYLGVRGLLAKGIKRQTCVDIWITGKVKTWGQVVGSGVGGQGTGVEEIHVYTRSDSCGAAETWAGYLGGKQEDLLGVGVYGDPGLAYAVTKDTLGIGFNNINYAYDPKTKKQTSGIRILPIDIDGDGQISKEEYYYDSRDEIAQAIAAGKYPSPPARDLHFVSKGRPEKRQVVEFIKWVLTEGQKFVPEAGYINLSEDKIRDGLKKIGDRRQESGDRSGVCRLTGC